MSNTLSNQATPSRRSGWDRFGALCGAAYVLLIMVGNSIATAGGSQSNTPTGRQALQQLAQEAHSTAARIGEPMEILGFVAFAFFVGWLATMLRGRGGPAPWLAAAVAVSGATAIAVKLTSVFPEIAGSADRHVIDARTALVLHDQAGAGFVVSFLPFGAFMLAAGLSVLATGALGRVAGWTAVVLGVLGIVNVALAHTLDTNPMPFLLGLLWILVVSVRLSWRGPRIAAATGGTTEPVSVAA